MRPTILSRYIISQFIPYFLVSIIAFTLIFLTHQLLDITNFIVNQRIGPKTVALMLIYSLPYFLELVIPIATMIAVLLVFLRMSGDNEIIALRSGGIGLSPLVFPVAFFCLATCLLTAFISIVALPQGRVAFKKMVYETVTQRPEVGIRGGEFNTAFKGITIYVDRYDKNRQELAGIFIEDHQTVDSPVTISAPSGSLILDQQKNILRLSLNNGIINQVKPNKKQIHSIIFKTYEVNLDIAQTVKSAASTSRGEKEMSLGELRSHVNSLDTTDSRYISAAQTWHKKFSIPFACLALGLLAIPLGIQNRKSRTSSGIGLALICFLVYYLMLSAGEIMGESGQMPPVIGAWLPNIVMTGLGIGLLAWTSAGHSLSPGFSLRGLLVKQPIFRRWFKKPQTGNTDCG